MDNDTRVALLALKAIFEHEQSYRGTVLYDHNVFTFAKVALEKTGYINRDVPAVGKKRVKQNEGECRSSDPAVFDSALC